MVRKHETAAKVLAQTLIVATSALTAHLWALSNDWLMDEIAGATCYCSKVQPFDSVFFLRRLACIHDFCKCSGIAR